ncbi:GNAT family N-acetyltransferase [Moritella viscosa]|uniref:Ribosomal-protein-serine N-acetyltransferase n=1 Tax=Moritella viscosa TaxID=80854 RepID=A0A1L0B8E8_9GAMM|nr:GNAT family N-acetyltransferase [Moritella viscosa]SGY98153.1 Putative ribosomal-protein-serine N-acetyltransferase [Moritella viscosa]SGZ04988.1 Putative ribosomal-protein-serine N-acetyltransferase [Moritella viscosa]SGZ05272.1 Putative ribosomal-protein-serine N-acetyltransferase [Moritella viscosa]SGZ11937.1 Putative ribosomal-protein-serine N-acetyltransferase [Moritella viscosa]SGZ12097.1 Putative ribosomal-protein-serine N-acetyltransferase [Moritella viscosa]
MKLNITENIELLSLEEGDSLTILNLVESSRPQLGKYLYWVDSVLDEVSAHKYIAERLHSGLSGSRWFKIKFNTQVCGVFGIKSISDESGIAEVGYWLTHAVHGNGIIVNVISQLSSFLLERTDAKIIEFRCLEKNIASISVAKKSGAKLVDSIPNYVNTGSESQELHIYQLLL